MNQKRDEEDYVICLTRWEAAAIVLVTLLIAYLD